VSGFAGESDWRLKMIGNDRRWWQQVVRELGRLGGGFNCGGERSPEVPTVVAGWWCAVVATFALKRILIYLSYSII
jgi:hypothetical protein